MKAILSNHRFLITVGCLIWCASFFGETAHGQPYSTYGIIISPIVTLSGIYLWFIYYKKTRGHYPRLRTVIRNTSFVGNSWTVKVGFLFKHILEFWTVTILFWMALVLLMVLTFGRSDALAASKRYCLSDKSILTKTGEIKGFGVLVGGTITTSNDNGNADLSFTVVAERGNFSANALLTKDNGIWTVDSLSVDK